MCRAHRAYLDGGGPTCRDFTAALPLKRLIVDCRDGWAANIGAEPALSAGSAPKVEGHH